MRDRNTRNILDVTFHETKHNPPQRVKRTERTQGKEAADKQTRAIAIEKARRMGAKVPK